MDPDYRTTKAFTELDNINQHIIEALIEAQTAQQNMFTLEPVLYQKKSKATLRDMKLA